MSKPIKQIAGILKMLEHNAEMQKRATQQWKDKATALESHRDEWRNIAALFKAENEELLQTAAVRGYYYDEAGNPMHRNAEEARAEPTLPRVITADELRDGQEVAGWHDHVNFPKEWLAGRVKKRPSDGFLIGHWTAESFSSIVLLADAEDLTLNSDGRTAAEHRRWEADSKPRSTDGYTEYCSHCQKPHPS